MRRDRRSRVCTAVIVALLLFAAACGDDSDIETAETGETSVPSTTAAAAEPADYSSRGDLAVGVITLPVDEDQAMEVFYPVDPAGVPTDAIAYRYTVEDLWGELAGLFDPGVVEPVEVDGAWRDLPAAGETFPLVVISHGLGGNRFDYSMHAAHLASWGYVVAVPQQPVRDLAAVAAKADTTPSDETTVLAAVAALQRENDRPDSPLRGNISDQVAVIGHSAGGRDAMLAAYDDVVDTFIALAPTVPVTDAAIAGRPLFDEGADGFDPAAGEFDLDSFLRSVSPPGKPSLMVIADGDFVYPVEERQRLYEWLAPPKRLVVLADTGHYVFADQCAVYQRAGTVPFADALAMDPATKERQLLEDGCSGDDAPVEEVWTVWRQVTVAHLELVFGDAETASASLDADHLGERFGERIAEHRADD